MLRLIYDLYTRFTSKKTQTNNIIAEYNCKYFGNLTYDRNVSGRNMSVTTTD